MKPHRLLIATLPTRIEQIKEGYFPSDKAVFLKRDDETGAEFSGNKVRKLEFSVREALDNQCDTLITCGGIQSNHARSTAAVAAKLGLACHLFLRTDQRLHPQGNYLLDEMLGAKIHIITADEYRHHRHDLMKELQKRLAETGKKAYIIPEGASNPIGTFGYFHAFEEILEQEKMYDVHFDTIVCAVGSGGTYAGLVYANSYHKADRKILGVNVCDSAEFFKKVTMDMLEGFEEYLGEKLTLSKEELHILDGHVGRGYALNTPTEMDFIRDFAKSTGVVLDPVYSGKAMIGLWQALKDNSPVLSSSQNILFIHTGGLFGLFPKAEEFEF